MTSADSVAAMTLCPLSAASTGRSNALTPEALLAPLK